MKTIYYIIKNYVKDNIFIDLPDDFRSLSKYDLNWLEWDNSDIQMKIMEHSGLQLHSNILSQKSKAHWLLHFGIYSHALKFLEEEFAIIILFEPFKLQSGFHLAIEHLVSRLDFDIINLSNTSILELPIGYIINSSYAKLIKTMASSRVIIDKLEHFLIYGDYGQRKIHNYPLIQSPTNKINKTNDIKRNKSRSESKPKSRSKSIPIDYEYSKEELKNAKEEAIDININNNIFMIWLHGGIDYISIVLRMYRHWEVRLTEIFVKIFEKVTGESNDKSNDRWCFVDIGANIGYFSLMAASYGLNVIAFEPESKSHRLLERSIKQNNFEYNRSNRSNRSNEAGQIVLRREAVSEIRDQKMMISSLDKYNLGATQLKRLDNPTELQNLDNNQTATTITGDYLIEKLYDWCWNEGMGKTNFIFKIDVEGMEPKVINGCKDMIQRGVVRYIMMEVSPNISILEDYLKMGQFLYENGYRCFNCGNVEAGKLNFETDHLYEMLKNFKGEYNREMYKILLNNLKKDNKQTNLLFIKVPT